MMAVLSTRSSLTGKMRPIDSDRRALVWGLLLLIVALGAALRALGVGYGLPAVYNPDEVAIMSRTLAFAKGDLNPHNFLYPTAYFYALFAWIGAYFAGAWITGAVESAAAFQAAFFVDPSGVYLAGRLLGVVAGTATIVLVFAVARRLFGTAAGLAAAALLAASPIHVIDSHYVKHDVPVTLVIVFAFLLTLSVWPGGRKEGRGLARAAAAGAACGVAFSTHYYAVFAVLPLALAIWFARGTGGARAATRGLAVAGVSMIAAFFACSPFLLVEPATAWRDIVANRQIVMDRAIAETGVPFSSARRYLELLWLDALGWPAAILAVAGAIRLAMRAPARAALLGAFPVAFLFFISNTVPASRYLNPVIPFAAVFAGYAVAWLAGLVSRRSVAAFLLAVVVALPALAQSVRAGVFFRQSDTRTIAREFIEARIPSGTGIAVQPYSVQLSPTRESLLAALEEKLGSLDDIPAKFRFQLAVEPWPSPSYRLTYIGDGGLDADKIYVGYAELGGPRGLEALRERGVEYFVLKRVQRAAAESIPLLEALEREAELLEVFSPYARSTRAGQARGNGGGTSPPVEPFLHNTDSRIHPELERPGPVLELWRIGIE